MANHSALLVVDVPGSIIKRLGDDAETYLSKVKLAVETAPYAKLPIIFEVVRFRPGYPEVNPRNI